MPEFFDFTDFNDIERSIRLDQVVEVRKPTGRVHDYGAVRLKDAGWVSFRSDSTAERLLAAVRHAEAPVRRACACQIPDPVQQADGKFYCHTCSYETGARPSVPDWLQPQCVRCAVPLTPLTAYSVVTKGGDLVRPVCSSCGEALRGR